MEDVGSGEEAGEGVHDQVVREVEGVGRVSEGHEPAWDECTEAGFKGHGGLDGEQGQGSPGEAEQVIAMRRGSDEQGKKGQCAESGCKGGRDSSAGLPGAAEKQAGQELEEERVKEDGEGGPGWRAEEACDGQGSEDGAEDDGDSSAGEEGGGEAQVKEHLVREGPAGDEDGLYGTEGVAVREEQIGREDVGCGQMDAMERIGGGGEFEFEQEEGGGEPIEGDDADKAQLQEAPCRRGAGAFADRGDGHHESADDEKDVDAGGALGPDPSAGGAALLQGPDLGRMEDDDH